MDLKGALLKMLLKPEVVGRHPGGLRFRVPMLSRIPPEYRHFISCLESFLAVPDGIAGVRAEPDSDSILVEFHEDRVSGEEVIRFLERLVEIIVANREELRKVPLDKIPERAERLKAMLKGLLRPDLKLDPDLKIPRDILD